MEVGAGERVGCRQEGDGRKVARATPALERAEVSRGSSPSSPQARSPHLGKVRVWNNRTLGDEKGVKAEGFGQLVKRICLFYEVETVLAGTHSHVYG